ncbi:hypothetical protein [Streptomyces sp. NBC_01643]|uniref:hypothetical protein n=1 Tax=Streptomyces sp. NBC_01643 TaxID=2975906 RepID=UPI00386EFFF1|nr:hypothetical protein OHB03_07170 [Streptomyces sp. NBC_01643]
MTKNVGSRKSATPPSQPDDDAPGLSAPAFAGLMGCGLIMIALFALLGGWAGLAGIVATATIATVYGISKG